MIDSDSLMLGDGRGRLYPGFENRQQYRPSPGESLWLDLRGGDVISCAPTSVMFVAALNNADGSDCIGDLLSDAPPPTPRQPQSGHYDDRLISARLRGLNLSLASLTFYPFEGPATNPVVWRINSGMILIIVFPEAPEVLVSGGGDYDAATVDVVGGGGRRPLPTPLGRVIDEFTIARATAQSYRLPKGRFVQIIDVDGRQCSDFMAFNARALDAGKEKMIDGTVSRTFARRAYPQPGLYDKFFDGDITPLLSVTQDTVGRHDTFALACTARGYEERGFPGHANCSDNISAALAAYGVAARPAWPAINFFFNTWMAECDIQSDEAWSRPGDYVLLRALTDLVCVSTACPDDIDPINGWNPTDIHVRLYADDIAAPPAVAFRINPNHSPTMTTESPFHNKTSRLTRRYNAHMDYWAAREYDARGAIGEYWMCRERATMQDMSNLRVYDIAGVDALAFLQRVSTRDISRLAINRGCYTLVCDAGGYVLDDGTLFNIGANLYRWTGASNETLRHFRQVAQEGGYHVWIQDRTRTLCALSVQGPMSRDILAPILFTQPTQPAFARVGWFGSCIARLHDRAGALLFVTRTGYTGELGYELFCDNRDAEKLWDAVAAAGGDNIAPMGTDALGILRVEAGLAAGGAEFGGGALVDAFDAGLGFALRLDKAGGFIGAEALRRNQSAPRQKLVGLKLAGNEVAAHGDVVYSGLHPVGVVTSAVFSPALQQSVAIARVSIERAGEGGELQIGKMDSKSKRLAAIVAPIPFLDPHRQNPRA